MWQLVNETSYAAERCFTRDRDGAEVWVVAVKATFLIRPGGELSLAEEQRPVCLAPEFRGEPGKSSLLYESDLQPFKPATDVLVHGSAHAPRDRPVTELDVGLRVGGITKHLRVFGNRVWRKRLGLTPSAPEPFTRLPIVYENAFGGVDGATTGAQGAWERRNPVGKGFVLDSKHLVDQPLPNVEDPKQLIGSWRDRPPPAGLGPLARDWCPRLELAGTYDKTWEQERQPLVPADFDDRFYQCAPVDQQVPDYLRGGEPVVLMNLSPGGELRFGLPRVWLTFSTHFGREVAEHRAKLHTVIIEPVVARNRLRALAGVAAVATSEEKVRAGGDAVCLGEGLTRAMREVLGVLPAGERVERVICDLNGERHRVDEYGFTVARLGQHFVDATDTWTPADCWGDVGAASGPLFACLAAASGLRGYARGPRAVIWASPQGGERGAALLELPELTRRV